MSDNDGGQPAPTIGDQINCAEREVAMRRRVYPAWVRSKRMTQEKADRETAAMQAIVETLKLHQQVVEAATEEGRDPAYKVGAIGQLLEGGAK